MMGVEKIDKKQTDIELLNQVFANVKSGKLINGLHLMETISEKNIDSPEMTAIFIQLSLELIRRGEYDRAMDIFKQFNISKYEIEEEYIDSGHDGFRMLDKKFPKAFMNLPEVHQAVRDGVLYNFSVGKINSYVPEMDFGLKNEFFLEKESQEAAEQGIVNLLLGINSIKGTYNDLADEISKENKMLIYKAKKLAEKVQLNPDQWNSIIEKTISASLGSNNSSYDDVLEIHKLFNLPDDYFSKPEVQEKIVESLKNQIVNGDVYAVHKIINNFSLDRKFINNPEVEHLVENYLLNLLKRGDISVVKDISFFLPQEDFLKSDGFRATATEGFLCLLKEGNIDNGINFQKKLLDMSEQEAHQLVLSKLERVFESLQSVYPKLIEKIMISPELAYSIFYYTESPDKLASVLRSNSFLQDALTNNDRFAPRLLVKWLKFGQDAQTKIQQLFINKKSISIIHPDLQEDSLDFRKEMQNRLMEFDGNKENIGKLADFGVNTDQWLNYQEVHSFVLQPEKIALSEQFGTKIDVLKSIVKQFGEQTTGFLEKGNYRHIASEIKVNTGNLEEESKLTENISKMKNKITELLDLEKQGGEQEENNKTSKQIEIINSTLNNMQEKLKKIKEKKSNLWEVITGSIDDYTKSADKLGLCQEKLKHIEDEYEKNIQEPSVAKQNIESLKSKFNINKEELKQALVQMERRFEEFTQKLPVWLEDLSQDKSSMLIDSLNQYNVNLLTHYKINKEILRESFLQEPVEKPSRLSNRPMSVKVWSRNPDIDLYQGNYCPCCVSIEGTMHGSISPIADYNTDLSIQVVNIYDEAKKIPVVAAWCWIGKNKDGRIVMVVDNIEANTYYSDNAPDMLTSELFSYLIDYAKASNVEELVLGTSNNDLPKKNRFNNLSKTNNKYQKIFQTSDHQCYLEAENTMVVSIWKKN